MPYPYSTPLAPLQHSIDLPDVYPSTPSAFNDLFYPSPSSPTKQNGSAAGSALGLTNLPSSSLPADSTLSFDPSLFGLPMNDVFVSPARPTSVKNAQLFTPASSPGETLYAPSPATVFNTPLNHLTPLPSDDSPLKYKSDSPKLALPSTPVKKPSAEAFAQLFESPTTPLKDIKVEEVPDLEYVLGPSEPAKRPRQRTPPPKTLQCPRCPLLFARAHDLRRHSTVHTGATPFRCHGCQRGFKRSDARTRHWRQHGGEACKQVHSEYLASLPVDAIEKKKRGFFKKWERDLIATAPVPPKPFVTVFPPKQEFQVEVSMMPPPTVIPVRPKQEPALFNPFLVDYRSAEDSSTQLYGFLDTQYGFNNFWSSQM